MKEIIRKVRKYESKFGEYGGQHAPETLMEALIEIERLMKNIRRSLPLKEN